MAYSLHTTRGRDRAFPLSEDFLLTLELPGKPVEKAGPLVPMYRGEAETQARVLNALLKVVQG